MQFKYPELLWGLLILLIPILVHLFQLRRFKKTPFTNVKLLQKVIAKSRKSRILRKWLLLFTRLSLLAALVFAFAQPFLAEKMALAQKETVIYLDDSFSMQLKKEGNTLLNSAVQELIKSVPEDGTFTLFTNEKVYKDVMIKNIQNDLLTLSPTTKQLRLNQIYLKARSLFNGQGEVLKHLIVLSDFQQRMEELDNPDTLQTFQKYWVKMLPDNTANVSIDSVYVESNNTETIELSALLSANSLTESIPVSLFNGRDLVAKTSATFDGNGNAKVNFTLASTDALQGKLEVLDSGLSYDNQLFFNIDEKEKINILAVGPGDSAYLKRIYTDNEFNFTSASLEALDYGILESQNLVILNELDNIPTALSANLKSYTNNGGWLAVIPSMDMDPQSYNVLASQYLSTGYLQKLDSEKRITTIAFSHPLYENVFERNVTNFQYPKVGSFYKLRTLGPTVLGFEDQQPFLSGNEGIFFFTASISTENSNFKNSPLIVPTFYNMGSNSLRLPELYGIMNMGIQVDVPVQLQNNEILKVVLENYEFIPRQNATANKASLIFEDNPNKPGIYQIQKSGNRIRNISFNHPRDESQLNYLDINLLGEGMDFNSITQLFNTIEKDNQITELWKWFIILALLLLCIEILVQKFFP